MTSQRENEHLRRGLRASVCLSLLLGALLLGMSGAEPARQDPLERFGFPTTVLDGVPTTAHRRGPLAYELDPNTRNAAWVMALVSPRTIEHRHNRGDQPFYAEAAVPEAWRVRPDDFTNSGMDRGHLIGAAFFAGDAAALRSSFSMVNIVPQLPEFNQQFNAQFEEDLRDQVRAHNGPALLLVAPIYPPPAKVRTIGPGVWVPEAVGVALLLLRDGKPLEARAWILPNAEAPEGATADAYRVTVDELEVRLGRDLWSRMDDTTENQIEAKR